MQIPVTIDFERAERSHDLERTIRTEVDRLERLAPELAACRVTLAHPGDDGAAVPDAWSVRLELALPGREVVLTRAAEPDPHEVVRDAFHDAHRRLEEEARREVGEVDRRLPPDRGRVERIDPGTGTGVLTAEDDGRPVVFARAAVRAEAFERLRPGDAVRFVQERGPAGPQATVVLADPARDPASSVGGGEPSPTIETARDLRGRGGRHGGRRAEEEAGRRGGPRRGGPRP